MNGNYMLRNNEKNIAISHSMTSIFFQLTYYAARKKSERKKRKMKENYVNEHNLD